MRFKVDTKAIRAQIFKHGWTMSDFSKATHLNYQTCRKLVTDGEEVNLKTIAFVARAFNINGEELILKEQS